MKRIERDSGAVLIIVLIFAVIIATFCMTSLMVSTMESQGTHAAVQRDKAFFVASAGLHDEIDALNDLMSGSTGTEPFKAFEGLAGQTTIDRRTLMSGELAIGEYTVRIDSITPISEWERDVVVTSTGWVPSPDHPKAAMRSVTAVLRLGFGRSEVFDYVYFINNWGWYYGSTIIANGNVRVRLDDQRTPAVFGARRREVREPGGRRRGLRGLEHRQRREGRGIFGRCLQHARLRRPGSDAEPDGPHPVRGHGEDEEVGDQDRGRGRGQRGRG